MKALITGASSGIGVDFAKYLSSLGYDLILVARRKERLEKLKKELKTNVKIISMDLSSQENCVELYKQVSKEKIDVLINNAGFGDFGKFHESNLEKELNMINVNIKAVHILTKLFLKDMVKNNKGYILNVASAASFSPGPLMATYYSTKSYVLRLTEGINEELRYNKSNVKISVLCPGPVETEFNDVANVNFSIKPLKSDYVAKYAIAKMFKGKLIIIPGILMKLMRLCSKILPDKFLGKIVYNNQTRKKK